jgi:hypothetical protein
MTSRMEREVGGKTNNFELTNQGSAFLIQEPSHTMETR